MSSDRFVPLAEPDLRGNEEKYLVDCVRTGWISSAGQYVVEMERRLAELSGSAHAVATSSGTTAFQLLLAAIGTKHGQKIIVPDWTFAATANAVVHAGNIPVLVDVHPENWGLDTALVADELEQSKRDGVAIGAVIAVDPLGLPADIDAIAQVCRQHNVPLIEDAAGSIGSTYKGRPAGGLADAGVFSFNGNKVVTGGGGGAIVTNNDEWARRAKHLSTQARAGERYAYDAVGYNYRLTNLNAAVAVAQLERLGEMIALRKAAVVAYTGAIAGRDDLAPPPNPAWADWNGWMYTVQTASVHDADNLTAHLQARGIGARPFWLSLSAQKPYSGYPARVRGISAKLSGCLVSLPCGSTITKAEIGRIIDAISQWRGPPLKR